MTIVQTARFLAAWTTSGALLLGSALWIPQARRLAIHVGRAAARRTAALAVAGIVAAVPIAAFPAYWATGILGQHRTIDMACLFFVLLWFIAIGAWAASGDRLPMLIGDAVAHVRGPLTALLLLALVASTNAARLIDDAARGRLTAFDREAGARAAALQDCHRLGRTFCAVDPIATIPASFFFVDISDNPRDWVNVAYARYFGVEDVRRRSREAEHVRD
jgi:hypothetical protein